MTPRQQEAVEALKEHGSISAAARALGLTRGGMQGLLRKAGYDASDRAEHMRGLALNVAMTTLDPAIRNAMGAVDTGLLPSVAWIKTKATADAPGYSVMLRPSQSAEDVAQRVRAALEGLEPAQPVIPPESVAGDLCNVFPLFDVHFGMHAWGKETRGQDYDLNHAKADLRMAFESVLQLTPQAQEAVLLIGGDFFHADDNRAETPAHRHKLDVDGRYNKVIDEAVEVMGYVIDRIRARHIHTTICVLRGNHDEHSHVALRVGLGQRFRLDCRVTVETSLDGLYMKQWGKAAIFAHHGDKAPPERQALYLSDVCPFWSQTRHRHYYTGHIHKDTARDLGPVRWESLRAFCPPDAYAASMGYASRRAMKADTYHKVKGRVASAFDPIERAA